MKPHPTRPFIITKISRSDATLRLIGRFSQRRILQLIRAVAQAGLLHSPRFGAPRYGGNDTKSIGNLRTPSYLFITCSNPHPLRQGFPTIESDETPIRIGAAPSHILFAYPPPFYARIVPANIPTRVRPETRASAGLEVCGGSRLPRRLRALPL